MPAAFRRPLVCPDLIGRDAEVRLLRHAIERASGGHGETVLLAGDAGIGKSRLAREAKAGAAARGMAVLDGDCFPQDRAYPYALIVDITRACLAGRSPDEVAAFVSPFGPDLRPLLPDVIPLVAGAAPPIDHPEQAGRRLMAAFNRILLAVAAERPLLIVAEDLHWCDDASLDVLHLIARQAAGHATMLLGTFRPDEADPRLHGWLAALGRERLALEIDLAPLSEANVTAMVAAMTKDDPAPAAAVAAMTALAEGNPFYVEELLASLLETNGGGQPPIANQSLTRGLQHAVLARTQSLSADAGRLLRLAAVIGRRFDLALLQRVAGLGEPTLLPLVRELAGAHLIVEEARDRFTFRHAIIRQGVYDDLLGRERAVLHRSTGEAIEALHAEAIDQHTAALAHHFAEAEVWEKALRYARRAGEQARRLHAPRAAAEQFTRALQAAEHLHRSGNAVEVESVQAMLPELHRERGASWEQLGEFDEAVADYEIAVALASAQGDQRAEWHGVSELGLLWARRDLTRAGVYLRRALAIARNLDDPALIAGSLNRAGNWRVNAATPDLGLPLHRQALTIFERLGDRQGVTTTLDLLGVASYLSGDWIGAIAWYERAVAGFRDLDDRRGTVTGLAMLAFLAGSRDVIPAATNLITVEDAVRLGEEAVRLAGAIDWRAGEAFARFQLAIALAARGDLGSAIEQGEHGLRIAEEIEHHQWRTLGHCTLGVLCMDLLSFDMARSHFQQMLALGHEINSPFWVEYGRARLAVAAIAQGDVQGADRVLATEPEGDSDGSTPSLAGWWGRYARTQRALAVGEPAQALALIDTIAATSRDGSGRREPPIVAIAGAEALVALGRPEDAEAVLEPVCELMQRQRVPSQLWRCHVALGKAYRAQGRDDDVRQAFAAARLIIDELAASLPAGAERDTFLRRATGLLPRAYRLSTRRVAATRFGGLTEREREVAALVARGKTNREIAEALVLGRRTVETHVANALAKLGAASRRDLAAWAIARGLLEHAGGQPDTPPKSP
ncbi:MAG: AAA family ATPase [Dehalococcoidia bacterium]